MAHPGPMRSLEWVSGPPAGMLPHCSPDASGRVGTSRRTHAAVAPRVFPGPRAPMTTTSTKRPESAGIAWAPSSGSRGCTPGPSSRSSPAYFTWQALAVCLILYWLTAGLGICLTYHRLLTHRSFATRPRWLEYVLTALGCCASEGGAIGWVADHRKHHAHADDERRRPQPEPRLPLGPHALVDDARRRHQAHHRILRRWAPDLYRDPVHRFLDRFHLVFAILMFAGLYALGGLPWLIWGGFVRSVAVLHTTWLVGVAPTVVSPAAIWRRRRVRA